MKRVCCLALSLLGVLVAPARAQDAAAPAPKKSCFWFMSYPDFFVKFDPATDQVEKKIKFRHGMPWGATLSYDEQRFFVTTDRQTKIEVLDRAKGEIVDAHDFSENGFIVRLRGITEWPGGAKWFVRVERVKRELDRFSFEQPDILVYDVAGKKIEKRIKRLPKVLGSNPRVSPDGKFWHVQNDDGDLVVIDPATDKEVAKIDLHTPAYGGLGGIRVRGEDLLHGRDPKAAKLLYSMRDPVQKNRTLWGVLDVDFAKNEVVGMTEWGADPGVWGMRLAKNAPVGVASSGGFGGGGSGTEVRRQRLVTYDMTTGKRLRETYEQFRPRQMLAAIAPDGSKIYVGGAGSDFEVFDAELKKLKTVQFDGEIYGQIHVLDD